MRRKNPIIYLLAVTACCFLLVSCKNERSVLEPDNLTEDASLEDLFSRDDGGTSLGSFGFGIDSDSAKVLPYEYTGEEVHIPFHVTGMDQKVTSEFGLMMFVDGIPQPFALEKGNKRVGEESYMHKFSLKNEETESFDVVFQPVTGKEGDRLGIYFTTILKPDFIPADESSPSYGSYHSLSAIVPLELDIKGKLKQENGMKAQKEVTAEDISQEIIDKIASVKGGDPQSVDDYFDEQVITQLIPSDDESNILYAKDGKVKFRFRIYGGPEMLYRTTIFINHEPVPFSGYDYIEITTQKGKMCTAEVEMDTGRYGRLNTIYAVSVPAGNFYQTTTDSPEKTNSILLVND